MSITKTTCENFRNDLNAALEALKEKYNMDIKVGNIRYSHSTLAVKIDCATITDQNSSVEEANFKQSCYKFGMEPTLFHTTFIDTKGESHKIVGLAPKSRKYPVLTRNITTNGEGTEATNKWPMHLINTFTSK